MKTIRKFLAVTVILLGIRPDGFGMGHDVVNTDKFGLNIGGRIQFIGYGQNVNDPVKANNRVYLFLKQARLNLHGKIEEVKYNTELAFAAEDTVVAPSPGISLSLLDFSFDIPVPLIESTWLKLGQYKVPYSRERLTYSGQTQFANRSIQDLGFGIGRDVGAAVYGNRGNLAGTFGIFTGGGRDVPQRFLPEELGIPLVVARAGYNDGLDQDPYALSQNDLEPKRTVKAAYINAMYLRDTKIGHSTVLNVKTADKSILLNSNWNPFIAKAPFSQGNWYQLGWDAAARGPISGGLAWTSEAEMNYGRYSNDYGMLELAGARVQAGLLKNPYEVALRYAVLLPDPGFANSGVSITGGNRMPITEVAPAFTYYVKGHDAKVVLDAPMLFDVPVFTENAAGSYVSTEQPDQATVIKPGTGSAGRQFVPEVRIMFQLAY